MHQRAPQFGRLIGPPTSNNRSASVKTRLPPKPLPSPRITETAASVSASCLRSISSPPSAVLMSPQRRQRPFRDRRPRRAHHHIPATQQFSSSPTRRPRARHRALCAAAIHHANGHRPTAPSDHRQIEVYQPGSSHQSQKHPSAAPLFAAAAAAALLDADIVILPVLR
ncbi:hypothetical protein GQ55_9G485000 [Panicum hallii var. hallii]|uniref:Uncharacterized protein n=1 Tax=Panicum hallii var. hallii TaxID=1504633 RepID=A0A2T7CCX8_9POAL|nr:hypothetical protein GQ55_9G485000 [Panicum hallii var. hallii]